MTVSDLIYNLFEDIKEKFPNSVIKYQYNDYSITHFVQVSPLSAYNSDDFLNLDVEYSRLFQSLNLEDDFCIISEDSITILDNPSKVYIPNVEACTTIYIGENEYTQVIEKFETSKLDFQNKSESNYLKIDCCNKTVQHDAFNDVLNFEKFHNMAA